ncbi:hypothetical protein L6Q21_03670 [Sandaracinobacter sp. RS1-74]|uniref:hypothetical protein n=1 Tax=Sandaracinobacteroides sayramensis TaxID=2913411 RepID=UPI001EDA781A|nr:hypothetical protein [Sandaracinobacteroides sayramensis]MCG2840083.1 hypothetical protein [Sandaracinobacteroides sayramensis]
MRIEGTLPTPAGEQAELRQAAQAFEALMLKQVLRAAMPAIEGANQSAHELALEGVAGELALSQPFGLARLLEKRT